MNIANTMVKRRYKVLDLFCGCGGISILGESLGYFSKKSLQEEQVSKADANII